LKFEQLTLLLWHFVVQQSSAKDVLAAGVLVADGLVLGDDYKLYKCCIICSLTSYKTIKK
jgi:hypothetical protein